MRRVTVHDKPRRREGAARKVAEWLNAEAAHKHFEAGGEAVDFDPPVKRVWCGVTTCSRRDMHVHEATVAATLHESGLTRQERRAFVRAMPRNIRMQIRRGADVFTKTEQEVTE